MFSPELIREILYIKRLRDKSCDGSMGKALAMQTWWSQLNPRNLYKDGRRQSIAQSCLLTFTYMPCHTCTRTRITYIYTITVNIFKNNKSRVFLVEQGLVLGFGPYKLASRHGGQVTSSHSEMYKWSKCTYQRLWDNCFLIYRIYSIPSVTITTCVQNLMWTKVKASLCLRSLWAQKSQPY